MGCDLFPKVNYGRIDFRSLGERVPTAPSISPAAPPPNPETAYLPGVAYDEMFAPGGATREHYQLLRSDIETLGAVALADRQKTLERSFLLQGITFTVYGAGSATERIIPTDLFPRIIPAAEWATIEAGLIQRLKALNLFLADIYGEQRILADGVVPRDLVLGSPAYRRQMQHLFVPHKAYANVCGSDLIRGEKWRVLRA